MSSADGAGAPVPKPGAEGSETVNVVPRPCSLATSTDPPCMSTSDFTIARPRPVPGLLRSSDAPR